MELETRLADVEGQQVADAEITAVSDDASELLLESEEKVRMLRDRLTPGEVVALHAEAAPVAEDHEVSEDPGTAEDERVEDEAISDDTEYVDDPQIDLLSA
jgi:hypothetical protein